MSIWFKLLRRTQLRFSSSWCESQYNTLAQSSTAHKSMQGFILAVRGCETRGFNVHISGYRQSWALTWGNATDESWSKRWSNVAFTFLQSEGLFLYFNGEEVKKQTVNTCTFFLILESFQCENLIKVTYGLILLLIFLRI